MKANNLNAIDRDNIVRQIQYLQSRVNRLETLLQGVPISGVKIADLSADKLSAGTIDVLVKLGVNNIEVDGANKRILVKDDTDTPVILIGYKKNAF